MFQDFGNGGFGLFGGRRKRGGSAAPVAYGLPSLSVAPAALWYPALIITGYTGPLFRAVRKSDGVTFLDVSAANGTHIPDYAALDAWAGVQGYSISIWYDQTGNGWHKTQTTNGMRPSQSAITARNGIRPIMFDTTTLSSGTVNKQMNFGPITGLNRTPMGYHTVVNQRASYEGRALLAFFNSALPTQAHLNMAFHEAIGTGTGQFGSFANTASGSLYRTGLRVSNRIQCLSVRNAGTGAASRFFRVNGTAPGVTPAGVASLAMTDVATDGVTFSNTSESNFDHFGAAIWTASPSAADMIAMDAWAATLFAMPGTPTHNLVYGGSSLGVSWRSTLNRMVPDMMARNLGDSWEVWNMAQAGRTQTNEATNAAANYNNLFNGARTRNILLIDAPSNDIATYASQAAAEAAADTFYTGTTLPFISAMQTTGYRVVAPTIIARTGLDTAGPFFNEWFRLRYNANLIAGAGANNYWVSDRAADSRLQNVNDTNFFDPDRIHLNDGGYPVQEGIDRAAVLLAAV
jgi:hypothetical protein